MCNLARILSIISAWLVITGSASAIDLSMPFVKVAVPRKPAYLGKVWGPGLKQVGAQLSARVTANCPYHLEASFQGLRHEAGKGAVSPKDLSVAINGRQVAVGGGRVPIAHSNKPTPVNGTDVPVTLEVGLRGLASYPAGRYSGILVITVTAGP